MKILLMALPLMTVIGAFSMYRLHGRREFLRFDLIQFIYAFVMSPLIFVWLKTILFLVVKSDPAVSLGLNQLFILDTSLNVVFMYVYAFVVIHSLTASFKIKMSKDSSQDIFHLSEYFHLWLSHIVIYVGGMTLTAGIAIFNLVYPLSFVLTRPMWYLTLALAVIMGVIMFMGFWLGDPRQGNFMRLIKLWIGFFASILLLTYFMWEPSFSARYLLYWFITTAYFSALSCGVWMTRSSRAQRLLSRFKHKQYPSENISLFQ